jgi:hypothetical protein
MQLIVKISTWKFRIAFFNFSRQWSSCQTRSLKILAQFNVLILVYIATYLAKIWERRRKKSWKKSSFWERWNLIENSIPQILVCKWVFFPYSPGQGDSRLVTLVVGSRCPTSLRAFFGKLKIADISAPRYVPWVTVDALISKFSSLGKCQNRRVGKNSSKNSRRKNVLFLYSNGKWS